MNTTTYGTGELIVDAIRRGCRQFMLGIGGSATNDAGFGMLQALGYRFLDQERKELGQGGIMLEKVMHIEEKYVLPELKECCFQIATDVQNPFCGPNGAAFVFAAQKGATPSDIVQLDKGMCHFSNILLSKGIDIVSIPGTGAGGGMVGGYLAFLNAKLISGIEMIKEYLHFDDLIKDVDLVITGEGKMDKQTLEGKAPWGVAQSAIKKQIPVIALTAVLEEDIHTFINAGFSGIYLIHPADTPIEKAMLPEYTYSNIKKTIENILPMILN